MENKLKHLYLEKGLCIRELAQELKVCNETARKLLVTYNIKRRRRGGSHKPNILKTMDENGIDVMNIIRAHGIKKAHKHLKVCKETVRKYVRDRRDE